MPLLVRQQNQILVVLQSVANKRRENPFYGDIGRPADRGWPSRIKKRAVAIAAEEEDVIPGIFLAAVCFIQAVVQLTSDVVLPCDPRHDPIRHCIDIDHVTWPAAKV